MTLTLNNIHMKALIHPENFGLIKPRVNIGSKDVSKAAG